MLIGAAAWLVIRIAAAIVETSYSRYASARAHRDPARVRRVRTQVTLIMRVVSAVVGVVAVATMLLTFPAFRAAGASLLASAGILGIVAGVAAQSTLSNMFAGFQIAFGDMVRIGDTVVVDGEWGTVEEITLTFLTVRTWDERRITMPVSYFTSKPFENWSRGTPQMTGIVFWHVDHSAPVEAMREKLRDILRECPAWDGRAYNLSVTDTHPEHHGGAGPGDGQGRGRHLDGAGRGPRADAPLAGRRAPVRPAPGQHGGRDPAAVPRRPRHPAPARPPPLPGRRTGPATPLPRLDEAGAPVNGDGRRSTRSGKRAAARARGAATPLRVRRLSGRARRRR